MDRFAKINKTNQLTQINNYTSIRIIPI